MRWIQQAPIGMALLSSDGSFTVNSSLCKMLGYSENELMNRTIQSLTHPDDVEVDLKLWSKLVQG